MRYGRNHHTEQPKRYEKFQEKVDGTIPSMREVATNKEMEDICDGRLAGV